MEHKYNIGLFAILCIAVVFGLGVYVTHGAVPIEGIDGDEFTYHGYLCVYKNGEMVDCNHNLITNTGKDYIKTSMGIGTNNTINRLVLSNLSAPAVTDSNLQVPITTCGLANATAAYSSVGTGNWSMVYTWTSSCSTNVNTSALYKNPGDGGTMFAGTSFTTVALVTNDQLTINYTTWVS